jgi:hypothetical protein
MLLKTVFIMFFAGLVGLMLTLLDRGAPTAIEHRSGATTHCAADPGGCPMLASGHAGSVEWFFATLASMR